MILDQIFPNMFIINMDHLLNKFDRSVIELNKIGVETRSIKRFSGIVHNEGKTVQDREMGCKLSHMRLIELAKKQGLQNICIFEDDIEVLPDFNKYLPIIKNFIENNHWDLFYFGGNHSKPYEEITYSNIVKCKRTLTTHAYVVNKSCYDELLEFYYKSMDPLNPIDGILVDYIQKKGYSYCLNPRKIVQRNEYSYIRNTNCDYDRYLLDACKENIEGRNK